MQEIKVLTIDDDSVVTDQIRDLLHGAEIEGCKISVEVENNFGNGKKLLQERDYDVVILDVYRGNPSESNLDLPGKEILDEIKLTVPIAVIFYTGLTTHIQDCASAMVRIVSKTTAGGLEAELASLIKTGLPLIRKKITQHTHEILRAYYWEFVDRHSNLVAASEDDALLEYLLLRRLAATLNREGVTKIFGKTFSPEKIHPLGFYICPPFQEDVYEMGDILKKDSDNSFHVVLTPSCDLAQKKADYLLLVPAAPLKETTEYKKYIECKNLNTAESLIRLPNLKDALIRLISSRKSDRFFFLPRNEFIDMPDVVLDFQQGFNHRIEDATEHKLAGYKKVCKIDDPFAQDMLATFIRNKNRPGSPDLDADHVLGYLDSEDAANIA
ncbi:MAG: hypothetical protein Q8P01_05160 [bacterium]|nr:hypothetical protein [bacterium]